MTTRDADIAEWISQLYPQSTPQQLINNDFKDLTNARNKVFAKTGYETPDNTVPPVRSSISLRLQTGGYLDSTPVTTTTAIPPESFPPTPPEGESYDPSTDPYQHINQPLYSLAKGLAPQARINQDFADVYYPGQPSMETYHPTGRERLGSAIAGPENKNADWARQLVGTTGMGPTNFGAIDLTPVGAVMGGQEALNNKDYQGAALSILPGVGGRGRFFSQAGKVVTEAGITSATPEVWANYLKNKGVKTEELNWLGLGPSPKIPAPTGPLTKDQLFDHINNNGPKITEDIRKGSASDFLNDPKVRNTFHSDLKDQFEARGPKESQNYFEAPNFQRWLIKNPPGSEVYNDTFRDWFHEFAKDQEMPGIPQYEGAIDTTGGKNYQETLLQQANLPPKKFDPEGWRVETWKPGYVKVINPQGTTRAATLRNGLTDQQLIEDVGKNQSNDYYGSHFADNPNVLVHALHDDRMIGHPETGDAVSATFAHEIQSDMHQMGRKVGYQGDPIDTSEWHAERGVPGVDLWTVKDGLGAIHTGVKATSKEEAIQTIEDMWKESQPPDAPFKKTYSDLMLKRLISDAAEKGHEYVAWPIGRTLEQKYSKPQSWFYDKELVNKANDIGKKYGSKVEDSKMFSDLDENLQERAAKLTRVSNPKLDDESDAFYEKVRDNMDKLNRPIHALRITDKLRDAAIKGFPLFTAGAIVVGHPSDDAHAAASQIDQPDMKKPSGTQVAGDLGRQDGNYAAFFLGARLRKLQQELSQMVHQGTDAARQNRIQQQELRERLRLLADE